MQRLKTPEEGVRSPEAEVTGGREMPSVSSGTELRSSRAPMYSLAYTRSALDHQATFPTFISFLIFYFETGS